MEALAELEMRPCQSSSAVPSGALRQVAEGEPIPIKAPPSPKTRAASEALLRLLAGSEGAAGASGTDAFFDRIFDSLGELDERFFADATDTLSGKEQRSAATFTGSMLDGDNSEDSSEEEDDEVTGEGESPDAGEAEAAEELRELEEEWTAEAAVVQSTWQRPPPDDDEFESAYDAPAEPPTPPGADVIAALRQRLSQPPPEEEDSENEDSMMVVGGLQFALSGPRRPPLTGERAVAMEQELAALRAHLK